MFDANSSEIIIGVFFDSQDNETTHLYASFDGINFYQISTPYVVNSGTFTLRDPGLAYRNGMYYSIGGYVIDPGEDLDNKYSIKWGCTSSLVSRNESGAYYPTVWRNISEGNVSATNNPISLEVDGKYPYSKQASLCNRKFFAVAPDLFIDDDDRMYIVFSAGYYAEQHADDTDKYDVMKPYLVEAKNISFGSNGIYSVSYDSVKMINLPYCERLYDERNESRDGSDTLYKEDRIDGSLYKENGYYYLVIKRFGTANELWRISDLSKVSDKNAWELLNSDIIDQFEGSSLIKFNGRYHNYCDKLVGAKGFPDKGNRIYVTISESLDNKSKWKKAQQLKFIEYNADTGTVTNDACRRHGSVLVLNDSSQIKQIAAYLSSVYGDSTDEGLNTDMRNGWFRSDGYWYWCEEGNYVAYAEKCIDGNWYWFDADGTMARNKNVYIPEHDKWVYYGDDGVMAKEEHLVIDIQFKYIEHQGSKEHWRYFDKITGEKQINSLITCNGITRYYGDNGDHYEGERNLDGYWYYFERREYLPSETDKKLFGSMAISKFVYLADGDKWVYYDENGRMLYGEQCINGNYYYFDPTTGAMQKGNVEVSPGVTHHYDETTGIRQD